MKWGNEMHTVWTKDGHVSINCISHIFIKTLYDYETMNVDQFWYVAEDCKEDCLFRGYVQEFVSWIITVKFTQIPFEKQKSDHPSLL